MCWKRRGVFRSVPELVDAMHEYLEAQQRAAQAHAIVQKR
jgi:hypothetical protein